VRVHACERMCNSAYTEKGTECVCVYLCAGGGVKKARVICRAQTRAASAIHKKLSPQIRAVTVHNCWNSCVYGLFEVNYLSLNDRINGAKESIHFSYRLG
jgi:hypothetical protein